MAFQKHRLERDIYTAKFERRLLPQETITGYTELMAFRAVLDQWVEVTAELVDTAIPSPDGRSVQLSLKAAATDAEQPTGIYRITLAVVTSRDRQIVGEFDLDLYGEVPA